MKISDDVLRVLSVATVDSRSVKLEGQLDRKLYLKTNEVLEALGGKWSRRDKAHVFPEDPGPLIEAVMVSGDVTRPKDMGFFPTPPELARMFVSACACVEEGNTVLEPSAGEGALVQAALDAGALGVTAVEHDVRRFRVLQDLWPNGPESRVRLVCADFASTPFPSVFDRVAMNPPFCKVGRGDHIDHVLHAYKFMKPGGILGAILPTSIQFRQDKRHLAFRKWFEAKNYGYMAVEDGAFREAGTNVRTVALRIVKD